MYILDNNILNILFYPHPARHLVESKIREKGKHNVWLSAIAVYEKLLLGVMPTFKGTIGTADEVLGFKTLQEHVEKLATFQILPFTTRDYENYKEIYNTVKKASMDCRYAASAKSRGWIVVTHDQKDFSVIKARCGVEYEDWTVAPLK